MGKRHLSKKKLKFFENQINKTIKNYSKKHTLNAEEIKKLKCQTVEPWKRILGVIFGFIIFVFTAIKVKEFPLALNLLLVVLGLIFVIASVMGNKKTVDELITQAGDGILRGILDSL